MADNIHSVPLSLCPECGETLDRFGDPTGVLGAPRPGDLTVCAYCGAVLVIGTGTVLTPMLPEAWETLSVEDRASLMRLRSRALAAFEGAKDKKGKPS